jgi:hypothetical protein
MHFKMFPIVADSQRLGSCQPVHAESVQAGSFSYVIVANFMPASNGSTAQSVNTRLSGDPLGIAPQISSTFTSQFPKT